MLTDQENYLQILYKHNETILAHIPMNVLIRKVSFIHFGIKEKKLENSI